MVPHYFYLSSDSHCECQNLTRLILLTLIMENSTKNPSILNNFIARSLVKLLNWLLKENKLLTISN